MCVCVKAMEEREVSRVTVMESLQDDVLALHTHLNSLRDSVSGTVDDKHARVIYVTR
jgi:hypothetical protein